MNYGILHNRSKRSVDAKSRGPLNDPRLREIAKQMGLSSSDFGKEAQDLWETLDSMATQTPEVYQEFITSQLRTGLSSDKNELPIEPTTNESKSETFPVCGNSYNNQPESEDTTSPISLPRSFFPIPGFVLKCSVLKTIKCQQVESKLFVNLCTHDCIEIPLNPNNNRPVPRDPHKIPSTSNLQIPLVVGVVRDNEMKDQKNLDSLILDVVFHPWVFERWEFDPNFKYQVIELALEWVTIESGCKFPSGKAVGKLIKSKYKGGERLLTADGKTTLKTHRYLVMDNTKQNRSLITNRQNATPKSSNCQKEDTKSAILDSPIDLLRSKENQEQIDNEAEKLNLELSLQPHSEVPKKEKMPLIQEIDGTQEFHATDESKNLPIKSTKTTKKRGLKKKTVIKLGFLNNSKKQSKPLYPCGSSEGRPASAYVNLLSRSKVVDLTTKENQEAFAKVNKGRTDPCSSTASEERDFGDYEFNQLCKEADADFVPHTKARGSDADGEATQFGQQLQELSKLF